MTDFVCLALPLGLGPAACLGALLVSHHLSPIDGTPFPPVRDGFGVGEGGSKVSVRLLAAGARPNRRSLEALPTLGLIGRGAGFLAFAIRHGDVPQNIVVLDSPRVKSLGIVTPPPGRFLCPETEGENLRGGCAMEPRLVVVYDV